MEAIGDLKNSPFSDLPTCHLLNALVKKFVNIRIFAYEKNLNKSIVSVPQYGSKSAFRSIN
jgi:hypothetical protein